MKKLFISCPMRDKTEAEIIETRDKMHKISEIIVGEPLEVIDSYIWNEPPETKQVAVYYLGESIKNLSEADYMATTSDRWDYSGCLVEYTTAIQYDIPIITIDLKADNFGVEL